MSTAELVAIAMLLRQRHEADARIADIIGRPASSAQLASFIAADVLDLEPVGDDPAIDGWFRTGPLTGHTVNVRHYPRDRVPLDLAESDDLDHYLVLTGSARSWSIDRVYLFNAPELITGLRAHFRRIGTATGVGEAYWRAAELHPSPANQAFALSAGQTAAFDAFRSSALATQ
jgi:hypothetical protein